MTGRPNPDDFSVNERKGEYSVTFDVRGVIRMTIKADSEESAKDQAYAMCSDEEFGHELDEVDYVDFHLRQHPPMYRVTRDGKAIQSSRLQAGDTPRDPDERGF